jgi:hypothetical protein
MFEELLERKFRIDLLEKDKSPYWSFSKLKYSYDYPTACRIVDNLSLYQDWIYGKPLPKEIKDIANASIITNNENFEKEINWILLSVRKYKEEINKFIEYKNLYDIHLIKGEYEQAENILNQIEQEICISLWSIENRFLIIELRKGLKENASFLSEINTKNEKGFIQYCAHFFSLKSEKELSVNRFEHSLLMFLLPLLQQKQDADFEYYLLKLNPFFQSPFFQNSYSHLPKVLAYENYNSVIDKYITLIKVLRLSIINLSKKNKGLKTFLTSRLFYLRKKINDASLDKLCAIINDGEDALSPSNAIDVKCMKVLDFYITGNYEQAAQESKKIIEDNPLIIELYPIYVKSFILQNKKIEIIGIANSFQQMIISALYDLYKKEKNPVDPSIILRKIAYNLSSIGNISYFLIDIVKQEIENDTTFEKLAIAHTSFFNPKLVLLHSEPNNFLKRLSQLFPCSINFQFLLAIQKEKLDKYDIQVSDFEIKYNQALIFQKNENYLNASKIFELLLTVPDLSNFQIEQILINLFFCKAKLKEFDYCLHLHTGYFFKNKYLVQKINVGLVKEQIKKERYKNIQHTIELPLFYFLTNSEDYDIHTAYECYLLSADSEKPSELIAKTKNYDRNLVFFLKNICTLDIFKHSPFITSTRDKLTERINVCQKLKEIDPDNKLVYIEEEASLSNKIIIQKGLQEIDESKIYVNQDSIIQNELKDLKSVFNRYVAISQLSTEKNISIINIGSEKVYSFSMQEKDTENSEFSKDPQYDIFKEMFYEVRDKFLYSKYGLKFNLSARIRHGALLGEIRPEFELLHLVTEKEKSSENYKANEYWRSQITVIRGDSIYNRFNIKLSDFSKKIDNLINNELLSKYLLIKTEKENSVGWFNYEFNEIDLQVIFVRFKLIGHIEYIDFIYLIFEELWIRTYANLQLIQGNIKNTIRDEFFNAIQSLETEAKELCIDAISDLQNNFTNIRVNIENKLDKIAQWFTITDTQIADFEFSKIVEVCCESLYNHYISKKLELVKVINFTSLIKGIYYTHFVDLVRIFLQNILDYASEQKVYANIEVYHKDNKIVMKIENPLKEDENIEELNEKVKIDIDIRKSQLDKHSGLYKALNIVKTYFENENNDLKITVEGNKFSVLVTINSDNILV